MKNIAQFNHPVTPTPAAVRARKYIDVGLDIYAMRQAANRAGDAAKVRVLNRALTNVDNALRVSPKDARKAQRFVAAAYAQVREACPTLPVPPPAERVNVVRAL